MKQTENGMSLVEFMLFIGLFSAICAWMMPDTATFAQGNGLEKQTQRVAGFLEQMMVKASYAKRDIQVVLKKKDYEAIFVDTKDLINQRVLSKGVEIDTSSQLKLSFYRSGVCTPATIRIKDATRSCVLRLALRGRITKSCTKL